MVVTELNSRRFSIFPTKAQSPLVIDANTVSSSSFTFENLKLVPWRNAKIIELASGIEYLELAIKRFSKIRWNSSWNIRGGITPETFDVLISKFHCYSMPVVIVSILLYYRSTIDVHQFV